MHDFLLPVGSQPAGRSSLGAFLVAHEEIDGGAEGVEDPQSLEQLTMLKCDVAQGYVVGRPMSFDELVRRLLVERRRFAA